MPQSQLRKKHAKHMSVGGGRPVVFDGGQYMELHGYWIPDNKDITVEVPIFQHAYYPKISATDTEVKQNIAYRRVTIPSLSTLRANGIDADRAVFVAEVVVNPRFIKHRNYFRTDFPASVKTAARRDNVTFVFPANDMPSARFKRKDVLQFWRQSFTPLLIKGRQYTSGRMAYFVTAPAGATKNLQKSLNLENVVPKTLDNLKEWHPALHQTRVPRKRGPRPKYSAAQKRIANEIVRETSDRMADQLLPMLSDKMELTKGSKAEKDLEKLLNSREASRSLLKETSGKRSRLAAVRRWVNSWLMPRLKRIAAEEGEAALDSIARFAFRAVVTVIINTFLGELKDSHFGQRFDTLQRIHYKPDSYASTTSVGAGSLHFSFKGSDKATTEDMQVVKDMVLRLIAEDFNQHTLTVTQAGLFNIEFQPNAATFKKIKVTADTAAWKAQHTLRPEALGVFKDESAWGHAKAHVKDYTKLANASYESKVRSGAIGGSSLGSMDADIERMMQDLL